MTRHEAPAELVELQRHFTAMLRTPLSTRTGTFSSDVSCCDPLLLAQVAEHPTLNAATRLGVYQRQYWLRLFSAMQNALPLTARLVGMFPFNQVCQQYLLAHPPTHDDLARVADGFLTWLSSHSGELRKRNVPVPKAALHEAVTLDLAWQRVWMSPLPPTWRPSPEQAATLQQARLVPTAGMALLSEQWPLMELRRGLVVDATAEHVELPKRLASARHWLLVRTVSGLGQLRLEPRQAQLYTACMNMPLDKAVERLQVGCSRSEVDALAARVHEWFAKSVELGMWTGATL